MAAAAAAAEAAEEEGAAERPPEMSDLDYLRSKMSTTLDDDDDDEAEGEGEGGPEDEEEGDDDDEEEERADGGAAAGGAGDGDDEPPEGLADHGRLFVRNLPFDASEAELRAFFEKFGPLADVHVPLDASTRRGKGVGYVGFSLGEHAVRACAAADGQYFQGRILHVMEATPLPEAKADPKKAAAGGTAFQRKRDAELKASAEKGHNWNALFMRADAVGDAMSERYGVDKAAILDPTADVRASSLAVRLAQGETHLIAQTNTWLAEHGISTDALQRLVEGGGGGGGGGGGVERSQTLMIVKNISPKVTASELRETFGKHGQLANVLLPPARTLALVEFLEVGEARRAFRAVAYSKLHGVPIYLEWAPLGLLGGGGADGADAAPAAGAPKAAATGGAPAAAASSAAADEEEEAAEAEGCTLFVKNLAFATTSAGLRELFEDHWRVRSATVVTKADPKRAGKTLSMGYGFVELRTAADAQQALRRMAGARLDGHILQVKLSARRSAAGDGGGAAAGGAAAGGGKQAAGGGSGAGEPSHKLAVRNVPFEASKRELRELFGAFGSLKTVRMPRKFDGQHRGFAFVEFVTKAEATKAMRALQSTHLYGRRLVLQYGDADQSVEELRSKVRASLPDAVAPLGKRRKGDGDGGDGFSGGMVGVEL